MGEVFVYISLGISVALLFGGIFIAFPSEDSKDLPPYDDKENK